MRIMYSILNILYSNKAQSKLYALTQKGIMEAMEAEDERWSDRTIYNKIVDLLKNGYIKKGLRESNANTYYITTEGVNWMKEVEGDSANE